MLKVSLILEEGGLLRGGDQVAKQKRLLVKSVNLVLKAHVCQMRLVMKYLLRNDDTVVMTRLSNITQLAEQIRLVCQSSEEKAGWISRQLGLEASLINVTILCVYTH